MRKVDIDGLKDLWEDFSHSVIERKVNLSDAVIYQVKKIYKNDSKIIMEGVKTDVKTLTQKSIKAELNKNKVIKLLRYSGCFYKVGNCYYVPNENVKRRCIYDYFEKPFKKKSVCMDMSVNSFTPEANALNLAAAFKKNNKIVFLGTPLSKNYVNLTGMKSVKTTNGITGLDIAMALHRKYKVSEFLTSYFEKEEGDFNFKFYCRLNDMTSADGTPLYVCVCDNIMGRKSIQVDIAADIEGRKYVLKNMDVEHRTTKTSQDIAEKIYAMMNMSAKEEIDKNLSPEEIKKASVKYIPKRERQTFEAALDASDMPILTAYDIIASDIFNRKKDYKTMDYDAGRRKYELALGASIVVKNS